MFKEHFRLFNSSPNDASTPLHDVKSLHKWTFECVSYSTDFIGKPKRNHQVFGFLGHCP